MSGGITGRLNEVRSGSAFLMAGVALLASAPFAFGQPPSVETAQENVSRTGEPFEFALIGDYPYTPRDRAGMPHLMDELRRDRSIQFLLHLGDIHSPQETDCSEALFRERRAVLLEAGHPLVLTPGDNDWADCKGDPVAQLETLRRVFHAEPDRAAGSGGFALRSQAAGAEFPELVENVIWEREGVVFATLHMIAPDPRNVFDGTSETRARLIRGSEAWLAEVFRVAKERDARGVFLATQVSLWQVSGNTKLIDLLHPELLDAYPVFDDFKQRLVRHVRAFERPVVLANGDTHFFRVDKPLFDEHLETIQTFTRVEGFGSPQGHWVRVRVEPERPEVFSFRQELIPENIYSLVPFDERDDGYEEENFGYLVPIVRTLQTIPKLLALVGVYALLSWGFRRWRAGDR